MSQQQEELYQLLGALCNETITPAEHQRLQEILADDADARQQYYQYMDIHLELGQQPVEQSKEHCSLSLNSPSANSFPATAKRNRLLLGVTLLVLLVLVVALLLNVQNDVQQTERKEHPIASVIHPIALVMQTAQVRFAVGSPLLKVGSSLEKEQKYALAEGELQIVFSNGAEVILTAPAVFEVIEENVLSVEYGVCSVYAPDGAEGFVVKTPLSHVVDLGTRFSVNVNESGETDVQVVEGEAEVHAVNSGKVSTEPLDRLTKGMAKRYTDDQQSFGNDIPYNKKQYTQQLPDRIIKYNATTGRHGGVENLISLTVQRGGKKLQYQNEELIGIEVIHYKGGKNCMTTALDDVDPAQNKIPRKSLLDNDHSLITGLINPGGQVEPLTSDPIMNSPERKNNPNTPGIGIRFKRPIINGPGPDVVLFDLHVIVQSVYGDSFHVSPLYFKPGLHSHTIRKFDINLLSDEALLIDQFKLHVNKKPSGSLSHLESMRPSDAKLHVVQAKALATGIDLSDLGYKEGETVEGLFIQNATPHKPLARIDPVFIAGLPSQIKTQTETETTEQNSSH